MPFGLAMGNERTETFRRDIENELVRRGMAPEPDEAMSEYITIMLVNGKDQAGLASEISGLIESYDDSFVEWIFNHAARTSSDSGPSEPPADAPDAAEDAPAPVPTVDMSPREHRRPGAAAPGLYQNALQQALPGSSSSAQKRTASARSPSPNPTPPKTRRTDSVPTGPRAMHNGGGGPAGGRSLLDRMGGRPQRNPKFGGHDEVQNRINNITGGPMGGMPGGFDPAMMGPMGMPPGMDMANANPMMLQEMMMNQMALMAQMASSMGIINPAALGGPGGPPFPPPGAPGFNNGQQFPGRGGRGGGRGGPHGRGRGGFQGHSHGGQGSPAPEVANGAGAAGPIAAPTPVQAASLAPAPGGRAGFVAPERPQSPTLCKFGVKCSNPTCRFSHPSPVATPESGVVLSSEPCAAGANCTDADCVKGHVSPAVKNGGSAVAEHFKPSSAPPSNAQPCRFGAACSKQYSGCPFQHPKATPAPSSFNTPCRFGTGCTRSTCPFSHPEGRVLPNMFHRGLTGETAVSVRAPETGTMGTGGNRSVTFNKPTGKSAQDLQQKMKELEQANKELAARQAAMASKKENTGGDNATVPATA